MRAHTLATCLVFAVLGLAATASAQTAPAAAASPALPLELDLGSSELDAESVRKAVELELQHPVVLTASPAGEPSLSVIVHANRTVTVSYRTSTGLTRTRSIGIPENGARGAEVIALLSGNLSRDEAAELLADLAAKTAPPAAAVASPQSSEETPNLAKESELKPDASAKPSTAEARPPLSPAGPQASAPAPLLQTPFPAINLSLVWPITLYRNSERRAFRVELGLGYSHVGELHGAGLNAFALLTERDVRGASFAGIYNSSRGTVTGVSGSGLVNRRRGLRGFEFGGLLNLASADGQGFAAAGLANLEQNFKGFQVAGLVNWAGKFRGWQVAGILNRARGFTGLQAAGMVNIADALSGLQLGVVNVATEVHGLQIGVVNVAKRVQGTSIGLVSVAGNGRVQPVVWSSGSLPLNVAAKFTVGPVYTQAGLGYGPENQTYSYELGLGGHFPIGRFFFEPGVHYSEMRSVEQPFDHELLEYGHYRLAAGLELGQVSPFAGLGLLQRFAHSADAPASVPLTIEVFGGAAFF